MIPVCRDETSPRPAGTDITLRLHVEIKFRSGKAGQFSTWHLFRFVCNFFEFFFVNKILRRAKTTSFEKLVKISEKSSEDTFLMLLQIFFKGFD